MMIKSVLIGTGFGLVISSLIFGVFLLFLWSTHKDTNFKLLSYVWLIGQLLQLIIGLGLCWGGLLL